MGGPLDTYCLQRLRPQNITPKTRTAVDNLLKIKIESPGPVKCIDCYPGHRMTAVATWADNIKKVPWLGSHPGTRENYSKCHFIDPILYCNKKDHKTPSDRVEEAIAKYEYNAVSLLRAAIVTLSTPPVKAITPEKAFALRYFIHVAGDLTQPFHATDPIYFPEFGPSIDTIGATKIFFETPSIYKIQSPTFYSSC